MYKKRSVMRRRQCRNKTQYIYILVHVMPQYGIYKVYEFREIYRRKNAQLVFAC